jgi:hypothetical protein
MKIAMFSWNTLHSHMVGGVSVHVTQLAAAVKRVATKCTSRRENRALLPVMMFKLNKKDYLERLRAVIQELYRCEATHRRTVNIHNQIWKGKVEVFRLSGHRRVKRCFAWSCMDGDENQEDLVVILEDATVAGPVTAVRAAIAMKARCEALNTSSLPTPASLSCSSEEDFGRDLRQKGRSKRSFPVPKDYRRTQAY